MEEDVKQNPWIEPENYYEGYQASIDKLKDNPDYVDFEKLCFLVFSTPDGIQLMNELEKRFIIPALSSPVGKDYRTMVIYTEGYKEAFRMLRSSTLSHEQRTKAEMNKQ